MKSSDQERIESILRAIVSEALKIAETTQSALEEAQAGRLEEAYDEISLAHILGRLEGISIGSGSDGH